MPRIAAILLAAGGSTRMGRPKQLLACNGQSLLRRAASVALAEGCDPVIVVLGAQADAMMAELHGLAVEASVNEPWQRGIGTSIRHGVSRLPEDVERAWLLLADQPLVTPDLLRRLATSTKPVAACQYAGTLGPPVLVARELFPELLALPDDRGAKHLWMSRPEIVEAVPCPEASIDIDTPADYEHFVTPPAARASPPTQAASGPGLP